MQMFRFDATVARPIDRFESRFGISPVVRSAEGVQVGCAHLHADGLIGFHEATVPQLFLVVAGGGWVRGAESERTPIRAGQAAFWTAGEWHESGTTSGLTAILVEGPGVSPAMMRALDA